jgi:hypothetical protein
VRRGESDLGLRLRWRWYFFDELFVLSDTLWELGLLDNLVNLSWPRGLCRLLLLFLCHLNLIHRFMSKCILFIMVAPQQLISADNMALALLDLP